MHRTPEQRRQLRADCDLIVPDFAPLSPAQEFQQLALWCEQHGVEHDLYGDGKLVAGFEQKVGALLGKPAAVFMPSGVMAQLVAVKIWAEAARLPRFGMHATSHLALHEDEAFAALLNCHGVLLGNRLRPLQAKDLEASRQALACVVIELPLREIGGQLPTWDELEQLKSAAQARGVPLHMDGARLWECAAWFGKTYVEIATGFDSVYVSCYKGIGGLSGAVLAGSDDFIAQARLWRRRMGGTLHHLSPMVASAAMRFDERLALMPALYQRALELTAGLRPLPFLRVNPTPVHTNLFHLYFQAPAEVVMNARDRLAVETRSWLVGNVRAAEVPGWSVTEIYVGDRLLGIDSARVVALFARLGEMMLAV